LSKYGRLKIIFMGTPDYAGVILEKLLDSNFVDVVGVFTQPDKPVGRKQIITPPFVKKLLLQKYSNIKIYQPNDLKSFKIEQIIKKLAADYIVVAAYGQILPKNILDLIPCINLHASLLPLYRGASPIQSSILNHDNYSGVTAMLMDEKLDTGDMIGFEYVKIAKNMMVDELFVRLSNCAASLCIKVLEQYKTLKPISQFNALSSYSKKIKKEDGLVDLDDADLIYSRFRAYHPWPGIYLSNQLKLKKIKISNLKSSGKKGEIVSVENDFITISCDKGAIDIYWVQPNSKKEMPAKSYILGKRLKVGDCIL